MKYTKVFIESYGYELAPIVVTSEELEDRLKPVYDALYISMGQLEALTGITERRWWNHGYPLSQGALLAAKKALQQTDFNPEDIEILIYGGVCRENFEPATACRIAAGLGISEDALIYDISNACLGVLNGIIDIANRIELGQIRAGMIVSCESSRDINDVMVEKMLAEKNMELFKTSIATFTGGSGAVAFLLTDGSFSGTQKRRLLGGVAKSAPEHHKLCRWHVDSGSSPEHAQFMTTDSVSVLKYGVELGTKTWKKLLTELDWKEYQVDKIICHQVGSGHQNTILKALGISQDKDYITYPYLGNIGTVSLPLTAAIAEERGFLEPGDNVGFLGIGSGLNCLMLGWKW